MKIDSISSSTVAVRRPSDSPAERRVVEIRAEHRVHAAGRLTEEAKAIEEALRFAAHRRKRAIPAVFARNELLQDPERGIHLPPRVCVPAVELGDVLELVLGQEAEQLELGVDAGLEPAEHLQDQLLVEDDRRVRLLGSDRARFAQLVTGACKRLDRRELDNALAGGHLRVGAHQVDELAHLPWVRERVELVLVACEQLVGLVRARVEARLDDQQLEAWILLAQGRAIDDGGVRHLARLRPEPPLAGDEIDQLPFPGHSTSSFRNWNQKNPRGARVSK
jgi:hypothetical protein